MRMRDRTCLDTGAILSFLEVEIEEPSFDYLRRLLIAYRDRVPYETATRLLRFRDIEEPEDRVRYPDEFWREKMALGAGGSCSDSTYAFKKLLDALGFSCSMAINSEGKVRRDADGNVVDFPRYRSHCSLIASFGADRFVADPCCGNYVKVPLPLDDPGRVEVAGETDEGCPYRYLVEPLGEAEGETFYELHNTGPGGGEYPHGSQMYIFRDRDFSDEEFEEHMRHGYREGYSSDHLSVVCRDRRTKIEYRYTSGRLRWFGRRRWTQVPQTSDHFKTLARAANIPEDVLREAAGYLEAGCGKFPSAPSACRPRRDARG
jgi:hypothetical protein